MRLIIGLSGASGAIYGVRLLQELKKRNIETNLVMTPFAMKNIEFETGMNTRDVTALSTYSYDINDLAAPIASGGFENEGMVVIPCSMKTLSGIANGYSDNLLLRAADVALKEGRRLLLVPRETPLNIIHLENMLKVARSGAIIIPAMPGFYNKPKTIDDMINHVVGKVLDMFKIKHDLYRKWKGT